MLKELLPTVAFMTTGPVAEVVGKYLPAGIAMKGNSNYGKALRILGDSRTKKSLELLRSKLKRERDMLMDTYINLPNRPVGSSAPDERLRVVSSGIPGDSVYTPYNRGFSNREELLAAGRQASAKTEKLNAAVARAKIAERVGRKEANMLSEDLDTKQYEVVLADILDTIGLAYTHPFVAGYLGPNADAYASAKGYKEWADAAGKNEEYDPTYNKPRPKKGPVEEWYKIAAARRGQTPEEFRDYRHIWNVRRHEEKRMKNPIQPRGPVLNTKQRLPGGYHVPWAKKTGEMSPTFYDPKTMEGKKAILRQHISKLKDFKNKAIEHISNPENQVSAITKTAGIIRELESKGVPIPLPVSRVAEVIHEANMGQRKGDLINTTIDVAKEKVGNMLNSPKARGIKKGLTKTAQDLGRRAKVGALETFLKIAKRGK